MRSRNHGSSSVRMQQLDRRASLVAAGVPLVGRLPAASSKDRWAFAEQ
jgi:hypothetical protein